GRRFNVDIDPETETIVTLGSKEGLANLAMAITSPGDVILVPNPSYPIHQFGFIIAGAAVRNIPIKPDETFFESLRHAVMHSVPKPTAVVLNYPNNPTAECVDLDFYEQVVDFCKFHNIYILSDVAYAEIYFTETPPPSILQVKGAKDISVEFYSLSKTYSMPGWRIGFASGNKELVAALTRIKSYLDYGAFTPIQVAATTALNGPQDCIQEFRDLYRERRDILVNGLSAAGWDIPSPPATMFAWAPLPKGFESMGSMEFSKLLLAEAQVAVSPGVGFGEHGDGHVRFGMVENNHRTRQALRNIKAFMSRHHNGS
ncbi:MAG: aminotransferase class I/II-fold pyridoxal phosphate-dependent enzyme, partial [Alphaproteobacteria bacterium]|nr:aminotransferase class I/II-fold pyridoxal phosphate-dependent enzyme [Alphaproteobacteria bacterium]